MYAIWRACERFGVRPEGIAVSWEDCNLDTQAKILSYHQIRSIEEAEQRMQELKIIAKVP